VGVSLSPDPCILAFPSVTLFEPSLRLRPLPPLWSSPALMLPSDPSLPLGDSGQICDAPTGASTFYAICVYSSLLFGSASLSTYLYPRISERRPPRPFSPTAAFKCCLSVLVSCTTAGYFPAYSSGESTLRGCPSDSVSTRRPP